MQWFSGAVTVKFISSFEKNIILHNYIDKHVNMHVNIIDIGISIFTHFQIMRKLVCLKVELAYRIPFIGWHPGKSTQIPDGFIPFRMLRIRPQFQTLQVGE